MAGELFQADLKNDRLISATTRRSRPSLVLSEMTYNPYGDYYRFLYDKREQVIFKPPPDTWRLPDEVILVHLAGETLLKPASFQRVPRAGLSTTSSLQHVADQSGQPYILPKIDIAGHPFFVDIYMLAFLDTLNLSNRVFFHWFKQTNESERPSLLYNTQTRTIAGISPKEDRTAWVSIQLPVWDKLRQLEESANRHLQAPKKKPAIRQHPKATTPQERQDKRRL